MEDLLYSGRSPRRHDQPPSGTKLAKQMARLSSYINQTTHYRQNCFCWGQNLGLQAVFSRTLLLLSSTRFNIEFRRGVLCMVWITHIRFQFPGCTRNRELEYFSHGVRSTWRNPTQEQSGRPSSVWRTQCFIPQTYAFFGTG